MDKNYQSSLVQVYLHDRLAVQIVKQAKVADESGKGFAIVFAAMGVTNDVANYFKRSFKEAGVMERVVMFLNLFK